MARFYSPPAAGGVSQGDVDSSIATHTADTTAVHGVTDTSLLSLFGRGYTAGDYIIPPIHTITNFTHVDGRLYYVWTPVLSNVTIDRIAIRVKTAVAATTIRLGIYADNGSGRPGALIVDGGTVNSAGTGLLTVTVNQALTRGSYWTAAQAEGGTPATQTAQNNVPFLPWSATEAYCEGFYEAHTGALGAVGSLTVTDAAPFCQLRVA